MKKHSNLIALILALMLMLTVLAGCSNSNGSDANSGGDANSDGGEPNDTGGNEVEYTPRLNRIEGSISDEEMFQMIYDYDELMYEGEEIIYFLVHTYDAVRYTQLDGPAMERKFAVIAPNVKVEYIDCQNDASKQAAVVDSIITNGAKYCVFQPVDENSSAAMLKELGDNDVFTIAYAGLVSYGVTDYYVGMPYDTEVAAQVEALDAYMRANPKEDGTHYRFAYITFRNSMEYSYVLTTAWKDAMVDWSAEGICEEVYYAEMTNWSVTECQTATEQCLTALNNEVDVIMVLSDDMATGAFSAITNAGLLGDIIVVGGADGTLEGIARVVAGWQMCDTMPAYNEEGAAAAIIFASKMAGLEVPEEFINYGWENMDNVIIPSCCVPTVCVTKDNVKELVYDNGYFTQEEVETEAAKFTSVYDGRNDF